jgi:hypothetical protein
MLDSVDTPSSYIGKVSTKTCGLGYDNMFTWAVVAGALDLLVFLATRKKLVNTFRAEPLIESAYEMLLPIVVSHRLALVLESVMLIEQHFQPRSSCWAANVRMDLGAENR